MDDRDGALAALQRCLRQVMSDKSPAGLLSGRALEEAAVLARAAESGEDLQASHVLGLFHWYRYQVLPAGEDRADFDAAVRFLYPVFRVQPEAVPEPLHELFARAVTEVAGFAEVTTGHAAALFRAYQLSGQLPLLVQAVDLFRDALHALPEDHPDRGGYLSNLGTALRTLFERTGELATLTEAVDIGRQAVRATPEGHSDRAACLSNLGSALQTLFERTGELGALTQAADAGRRAVQTIPEDHPDRAACLNNLGHTLRTLFEQTGDTSLLAEAVDACRRAVRATPEDQPDRAARRLNNLSVALRALFERTGDLGVLDEAVDTGRKAVQDIPEDHSDRASCLSNLGNALLTLFVRTGSLEILAEAVDIGRQAVQATTSEDHPERATRLNNLGLALRTLFVRTGDLEVLAEAVDAGRQAVQATPEDHPERAARLTNLGASLRALFVRTGDLGVLAEAVDAGRQSVEAIPDDHPGRSGCLNNLGTALRTLFEQTGSVGVLAEAVDVGRQAAQAAPEDHPDHAARLTNLGAVLRALFGRTGDVQVLAEAVDAGRQAVRATPEDHPDRATCQIELGLALWKLFEQTGDTAVLAEAAEGFRSASQNAATEVSVRLEAYRQLAALADPGAVGAGEALDAMESVVALLPQISPRTLARSDREHQVGRLRFLADAAAAAALSAGDPHRAVELLEATRGTLVADSIDARGGEVVRLREHHPELAREFEDLRDRRDALDHAPTRPGAAADAPGGDLAGARREAQAEWDDLVGRIRATDGFSGFLAAPSIAELAAQADHGPIVFLTAGPARCDALVVTGDAANPVQTVSLHRLTQQDAVTRADQLRNAQRSVSGRDLDPQARTAGQQEILDVLAWLWDTVAEPVLTALGHTATPHQGDDWPRIWWCPVGVMAYLPVHAARHHRDLDGADSTVKAAPRTVLDRVVSSYTPTVRALAYARSHPPAAANATLVVAVSDAPGTTPLPGVQAEADAIITLIPKAVRPARPVRAEILAVLPSHPVAHFCCHGHADWNDPAASRLILHDHQTHPLTVADINALHLTGSLAYLSACETSSTRPRLADEALHLAGAFHLAGYQNVIGTLWSVNDHTATRIASDFYTHLTQEGTTPPDTTTSARALHHTIRALRAEHSTKPTHWAAHIHTGI